jgi:hypothetical protein
MASGLVSLIDSSSSVTGNLSELRIYSVAYTIGNGHVSRDAATLPGLASDVLRIGAQRERESLSCWSVSARDWPLSPCVAGLGILISRSFVHVALAYRYRAAARLVPLVVMGYLLDAPFSLFRL